MATPITIRNTGALVSQPAATPSTLLERMMTDFEATYQVSNSKHPSIVGATDGSPFVVSLDGMTKVRVMALKVLSGALKVKVTSAAGTDQSVNVGGNGMWLWHSPFANDEITAIKLVGTGDIELILAGDL